MANRKSEICTFAYNGPGYDIFFEKWQRCREVYAGEDRVKQLGNKYLPMSNWHRSGNDGRADYEAFKQRAIFFDYFKDAIQTMLGVLGKGEPSIELPKSLSFMKDSATSYKDGLAALKGRLDFLILLTGRAGLSVEVNAHDGDSTVPDFYINMWQPESIKDREFIKDSATGETYVKFVLLDETDDVFDYATKRREPVKKWRVMALDAKGAYYTATVLPEAWPDFDINNPPVAADESRPSLGEAVYPKYRMGIFNRVPFSFVNSTDLSGGHYQDPPLEGLARLVLALYRGDADYRQTLHFTASDFYQMLKCDDEKKAKNIKVGAGGMALMPGESSIAVVSSPGGGASMQKESLDTLHELCQRKIITLLDVSANLSGVALQMIQGSKSALIEPLNQNTGRAIEEQLRYAAQWTGMKSAEAFEKVKFVSAKIEDTALEIAQLLALWTSMKINRFPIVGEDFHALLKRAGMTQKDFDENVAALEAERAAEEAQGLPLPGEPNPQTQKPKGVMNGEAVRR